MTDAFERLEQARAEVARIEREIATGPCRTHGHDWQSIGGCNAGCHAECGCSVPVNTCAKCGDCDYGKNDDAVETRRECAERWGEPSVRFAPDLADMEGRRDA